jgi:hypothetical protein
MSKSGSRYGRRSNWFKIHCLLQEQQQNKANNNSDAGNKLKDLNEKKPNLVSTHFLSNLYNNNNNNINFNIKDQQYDRSSSSDSGASSADLEDSFIRLNNNNYKDFKIQSAIACETENVKSIKPEPEGIETINSLIKPASPFLSCNTYQTKEIRNISDFYKLQLPQVSITPNPVKQSVFQCNEQNEPIDLSVKAGTDDCRQEDPNLICELIESNGLNLSRLTSQKNLDHKLVPLDLTLLKTNNILERS